jgi:hypothetical protein
LIEQLTAKHGAELEKLYEAVLEECSYDVRSKSTEVRFAARVEALRLITAPPK